MAKLTKNFFVGNAFSLQMLDCSVQHQVTVTPVTIEEVSSTDFVSVVGHQDTAAVCSSILGKEVAFNRTSLRLMPGDVLYVAQVVGGRLPEGVTELPDGFQLTWLKVIVNE